MPQGDKSKYTDKQKRQTEHIEGSYEDKGVFEEKAKEIVRQLATNRTAAVKQAVQN